MEQEYSSSFLSTKRYAVVTGGNKGIGFEICRQLASNGIKVVLTARDEKRGVEAVEKLIKESNFTSEDNVVFHRLDVVDPHTIASLADYIKSHFGKLDILINNAGIAGGTLDSYGYAQATELAGGNWPENGNWNEIMTQNYESAEECLKTNYYGAKATIEALVPLLQLSDSPRIVNVSSSLGLLQYIPNEWAKNMLSDVDKLREERIDEVVSEFLNDFKQGKLEAKKWPTEISGYKVSKASLNAYTRILAKKYPQMCVNCVCPGYVKTDITCNTGQLVAAEVSSTMSGASERYAIVTGANKGIGLEIVRQLALNGVNVVLTARDEKRGLEALEKLKEKEKNLSHKVLFHQLDVADPASIVAMVDFIKTHFGKLDILTPKEGDIKKTTQTYESAKECMQINYYGAKKTAEELIPLLQLSDSPRIVNVSSTMGKLQNISNDWAKGVLSDAESLTEDKIDEVIREFLKDFKEGSLETKGWPSFLSPYTVSKAALNAFTRVLAKKYPNFIINCVCPGFVKTEINFNTGILQPEEGAASPVRFESRRIESVVEQSFDKNIGTMEEAEQKRYAVVTGSNKGIGFGTVKELTSNGIVVVLTARDEKKGLEAVEKLAEAGLSQLVVFHQLDVTDPSSISALTDFVKTKFGKLDILVNNAGLPGGKLNPEAFHASDVEKIGADIKSWSKLMTETYELTTECVKTNFYGAKAVTEALLPLLQLSDSPRIVNVSSYVGKLTFIPNEWAKGVLSDVENLTEDKIDQVLSQFTKDCKEDSLESKGWPTCFSSYVVSKACLNAYTRIVAKKYPNFCVNCICPGYVKTDINCNSGVLTVEEASQSVVSLALLPNAGPTSLFFHRHEVIPF
ncbi:hypothetical protein F8388_006698 [Cannabis sativa]|uniref:Uncharacterized protein n=1 Tax=Cannabis sativa TaxID=3483 RepID=A0A7J6GUY9_CANSA|nr:hypothetical protein F8388_006698 [Cannabis sativa]